jgi:hypothetical protein
MDNPDKLPTEDEDKQNKNTTQYVGHHHTQDEDIQNEKHNTVCVRHHYTQTNTNKRK